LLDGLYADLICALCVATVMQAARHAAQANAKRLSWQLLQRIAPADADVSTSEHIGHA
jgi:hypothetical protein